MSDVTIHPIRFVLSDVDGTLLHPDHSLSQRTADAIRAMREAGVIFSLASGRPPKAMRHLIETFGIDVPVAGFNGGTLVNPDGSILVAHHLPAEAALITLALFSADVVRVRPCFVRLRELRERLRDSAPAGVGLGELSMGMSGDFEIAIEEGATVVRVGQAIFGARAMPDAYYWPTADA